MDNWLTRIKADTSTNPIETKVRSARPTSTADFCILSSDAAQTRHIPNGPACNADPFLRAYTSPRQVAGGPLSENVLKCQLKPLDPGEYGGQLTGAQIARLRVVFPTGVCDWAKPGAGQQPAIGPLNFGGGPGGQPLPAPPVSVRTS